MDVYKIEEELIGRIKNNIKWVVRNKSNGNQKDMAKDLQIKDNTLSTYINGSTKPSVTFIYTLCKKYEIPLEMFFNKDLEQYESKLIHKEESKKSLIKYEGIYYGYFFVIDSNSDKEGLIQEAIINIALNIENKAEVKFKIINSSKEFTGSLSEGDELVFLTLKNKNERVSVTLKNPGKNIKEKYIGGIGIVSISSPEDSRIPSAQKIIISRAKISVKDYYKNLKEFLEIRTYVKIQKKLLCNILINRLEISIEKQRKLNNLLTDNKISESGKLEIDEIQLELLHKVLSKEEFAVFKECINEPQYEREVIPFESIKVHLEEDKMFYRFVKNEFNISNI